jgi:hypothetical protein
MSRIETECYIGPNPPWKIIRETLREGVGTRYATGQRWESCKRLRPGVWRILTMTAEIDNELIDIILATWRTHRRLGRHSRNRNWRSELDALNMFCSPGLLHEYQPPTIHQGNRYSVV